MSCQGRRLTNSDSTRYQSDPVHGDGSNIELSTDEGNYLVPNTKQSAVLYTPVVVHENSETGRQIFLLALLIPHNVNILFL